jgi:hypothetical protein
MQLLQESEGATLNGGNYIDVNGSSNVINVGSGTSKHPPTEYCSHQPRVIDDQGKESSYYSAMSNPRQFTTQIHVGILDATPALEKNTLVPSPAGAEECWNRKNGRS